MYEEMKKSVIKIMKYCLEQKVLKQQFSKFVPALHFLSNTLLEHHLEYKRKFVKL